MRDMIERVLGFIKKHFRSVSILLITFLVSYFVCDLVVFYVSSPKRVDYIEFKNEVNSGKVDIVYIDAPNEEIRYALHTDKTRGMSVKEREALSRHNSDFKSTYYPAGDDFREDLLSKGVIVLSKSFSPKIFKAIRVLIAVGMVTLLILICLPMLRGSNSTIGKQGYERSSVTFDDVIGHTDVKKDLLTIAGVLKSSKAGDTNGVVPKGILLSGEAGVGKTLLAKALAGTCGMPFIYANASEFIEMYAGLGAKRVRKLFKTARSIAPCILFIDEIDSIGQSRGIADSNGERLQTLNALLQEMDGFDTKSGVFIIGATNIPESLDKALTRAGRFDRQVKIMPPKDWNERAELFKFYLKGCKLDSSLIIEAIARQTTGFTGADIRAVVCEAKLIALQKGTDRLSLSLLEEAIDKKNFKGNRRYHEDADKDKEIIAYHEAGHAVMMYLCNLPIARITIVGSTSGLGGFVLGEDDNTALLSREALVERILVAYAGRCAESLKFQSVSSGASNDLVLATRYIVAYVDEFAFHPDAGNLSYTELSKLGHVSEDYTIEHKERLSRKCYNLAYDKLKNNFDLIEALAKELLDKETLTGDRVIGLLSSVEDARIRS